MTKTAREIFKTCFEGRKLVNTRVVKQGKFTKQIAYEISAVSSGAYCGTHILMIANEKENLTSNYLEYCSFDNILQVEAKVEELKKLFKEQSK